MKKKKRLHTVCSVILQRNCCISVDYVSKCQEVCDTTITICRANSNLTHKAGMVHNNTN